MIKLVQASVFSFSVILCSCGIMPGMQNLNTSHMPTLMPRKQLTTHPTLIPITPALIKDQHISYYRYRVASSDILNIHVWQHPEFNFQGSPIENTNNAANIQGAAGQGGYLVNADGQIYFPLVGYIHVAGKTVDQIRASLTVRLKKYIPDPQINIRVADYRARKVYVLGEVIRPGFLPINDQPLSIADALALSGGMDPQAANPRFTYVIRGNYLEPQVFWLDARTPDTMLLAEHFSLKPNDILFVSSAPATRWNRVLNQLLPTIQSIWYTQAIIRNS